MEGMRATAREEDKKEYVFVRQAHQPGKHVLGGSGDKVKQKKRYVQPFFIFQKGNGLHFFGRNEQPHDLHAVPLA